MIVVFPDLATLQAVPSSLPSGVQIGTPLTSLDGRVAIAHPFTEGDLAVLSAAGTVVEELPGDWEWLKG
jgi:hypothetical protein